MIGNKVFLPLVGRERKYRFLGYILSEQVETVEVGIPEKILRRYLKYPVFLTGNGVFLFLRSSLVFDPPSEKVKKF